MSFLPDIDENDKLKDFDQIPRLYKPPHYTRKDADIEEAQRLEQLNNLGRSVVSEDFSDSPHYAKDN